MLWTQIQIQEIPPNVRNLYCKGGQAQAAHRGYGVSTCGHIQNLREHGPGQPALDDPALSMGVGLDDLKSSLPTSTTLWFCEERHQRLHVYRYPHKTFPKGSIFLSREKNPSPIRFPLWNTSTKKKCEYIFCSSIKWSLFFGCPLVKYRPTLQLLECCCTAR